VQVDRVTADQLDDAGGEPSAVVGARVRAARAMQQARAGMENARLPVARLRQHCAPTPEARRLLAAAVDRLGLTARGFHRAMRVARTIADLAGADQVVEHHVQEALSLRHAGASEPAGVP
jgi:magnesium chelatase family protein